jgi:hypothetical protein
VHIISVSLEGVGWLWAPMGMVLVQTVGLGLLIISLSYRQSMRGMLIGFT